MSKIVHSGKEARDLILGGVDFLADVVKITEGPRGRNVILGQRGIGQSPRVTRDGVSVCNYVDPADPTFQMGADLIREAAQKTDNAVGDGTTASIVLAQSMIHTGFDLIGKGFDIPDFSGGTRRVFANPMAMERGIHKATDAVVAQLLKMAQPVDDEKVFQIATVSTHGDTEIGQLVADAIKKAGKDGVVTAEPSTTSTTYVESVAGMELPKSSLLHQAFITHPESMSAEYLDCRVLLWEGVISTAKSLVPILAQLRDANRNTPTQAPLLLVAGGYEQEALAMLILNRIKERLPLIAVRMDAYGERRKEVMRDIAALIGGKAYTEDEGLKIDGAQFAALGQARKVVTDMAKTQIIGGRGNQTELVGRVDLIKQLMETAPPGEKVILKARLAALTGGITIIKVGGQTVTEMEERKDRVVDAMSAAKAAVESGAVAGGGTALLQASAVLASLVMPEEERPGLEVVHTTCRAVVKQIAENAGVDSESVVARSMAVPNLGYNAFTGEFEDLIESGIIDPVRVVIEALQNAAAVSCSILTMGATVAETPQERPVNV